MGVGGGEGGGWGGMKKEGNEKRGGVCALATPLHLQKYLHVVLQILNLFLPVSI